VIVPVPGDFKTRSPRAALNPDQPAGALRLVLAAVVNQDDQRAGRLVDTPCSARSALPISSPAVFIAARRDRGQGVDHDNVHMGRILTIDWETSIASFFSRKVGARSGDDPEGALQVDIKTAGYTP